jgi:hypothetical protein
VLALLLVLVSGCPSDSERLSNGDEAAGDDASDDVDDPDVGNPAPELSACVIDDDCVAVAATCCECPSFAVHVDDPLNSACLDVDCDNMPTCSKTSAVCQAGFCQLTCDAVACDTPFPDGYATDAAGCLVCAPAVIADECTADEGCVETREDCCGCQGGGSNTAVPVSTQGAFDDALDCEQGVACPGVDTCDPNAEPMCTQGRCELLSSLPPAGACGDGDPSLPACPTGQACVLNLDPAATVRGLGVCVPQ